MVKISVIVPVFNVENFIERCLESLINQTFEEIEIICIDDGSTDSSLKIIKEYKKRDNRIRILSQENQGPSKTRNNGIELANGEYVTFVDSDDWIELDCLEKVYYNALSNDSEVVLFNAIEHRRNNKFHKRIYLPIDDTIDYNNFIFDYNYNMGLVMNNMFVVWSKLYKTSFLRDNDIKFNENFNIFEDVPYHIETILMAKKISYCHEILYNYNKLNIDSQQTQKVDFNNRLPIFEIYDYVEELLEKKNLKDIFKQNFIEFKLLQSQENLTKTELKFKHEFYQIMRKEFIKMRLDLNILKKLPFNLYQFYIKCINFKTYFQFSNFTKNIKLNYKYIDKKTLNDKIDEFDSSGIILKDNSPLIIVSLTSFPERMYDIHYCLYSLLNQSFKPNKVILWLAEEQFPNNEKDIPDSVLNLKDNGLEIKWCKDLKSYKKLIPALKEYPNDYIITADDDIYYPHDWLENIWKAHEKYPNSIISSRSRRITFDENNKKIMPYANWKLNLEKQNPSYFNFPTGAGGILYCPQCLYKEVLNEFLFNKLSSSADDIWFWAMMVLNKTKIYSIENPMNYLCYVNVAREANILDETTLWGVNQEGQNDVQFNNVLNYFPEILEILKNSYCNDLERHNYQLTNDKKVLLKHFENSKNEKVKIQKRLGNYTKPLILKKLQDENYSDLTIAIKTPNPIGHHHWGDYFFAVALKKAFEKKGFNVIIHERGNWYENDDNIDINLVLRGKYKFNPQYDVINIMWNIYDPDKIKKEEYEKFDICFISSEKYANYLSNKVNANVKPLLQCTDPDIFYQEYDKSISEDILFVGSTRGVYRDIIKDVMDTEYDVTVYGRGWSEFIDEKYVKGTFISNEKLHRYYSACKILLNDHWEDMRDWDFPSNRIFDALACGTFVISDKIPSADTIFEGNIVTYENVSDLNNKLEYYLTHEKERKTLAEKGKKIVLKNHTFDNRVDAILKDLKKLN